MIIVFMTSAPIRTIRCCLPVLLLVASVAQAFNAPAHRVVGHIAAGHVCAATATAITELDPDRSLAEAGTWADEIRSNDYWDALKPWHYMNVPDGVALEAAKRSARGDVWLGVEKFAAELADPQTERLDRQIAYRLLVHFVADIHQPLHVGRKADLGGNKIMVRIDDQRTSLHAYWDGFDLARVVDDPRDYARYLTGRFAGSTAQTGGGPADWARESLQMRATAYALPRGLIVELSDGYRENAMEIINLRLYQAGVRLAGLLDAVYCGAAAPGVAEAR